MTLNFEEKQETSKTGRFFGFFISYVVFTTILYLILNLLNKLPENIGYFHMYILTIYIILIGILTRKVIE